MVVIMTLRTSTTMPVIKGTTTALAAATNMTTTMAGTAAETTTGMTTVPAIRTTTPTPQPAPAATATITPQHPASCRRLPPMAHSARAIASTTWTARPRSG
ncbi:hypothetical protein WJ542_18205 [Paraburkholderia sp. B3]|uniref:hypothetical protein n=1 Tax=Paraburkholderia sp. B3 TaxID=3134791 RepID=UPI00398284A0